MAPPKDPRIPKKNPRLNYIDQLMRFSWSAFRGTKDHEVKKESLINLRARIDEWLAEPGTTRDLENNPSVATSRKCWSKISPPDAEFPFDRSGGPDNSIFFYGSGSCSELFQDSQMDLDEVKNCVFGHGPYLVTQFEKVFATDNDTAGHFSSETAFDKHAKSTSADKPNDPDRYFVMADPAGHVDGITRMAASNKNLAPAKKMANELALKFNIRFVIGRVIRCINVH
ncbi:MAG: hypothetical protein KOO60_14680 [Gemmatimonadales bacterium]|nr:hypothetical protein [Gemmatimonadales bacterium]